MKKILVFLFVLCCGLSAQTDVSQGEDWSVFETTPKTLVVPVESEHQQAIVDAFNELRLQYTTKVVGAFLAYQKPRDILACLVSLTNQLNTQPSTIGKALWDRLLRNLEATVLFLEKIIVVDENEPVFHVKPGQKETPQGVSFFDWWKKNDQDSFVTFFGLYFDYHLIGLRAVALSAWEAADPDKLYSDPTLRLSLKALEQSVSHFKGLAKFHGYYERTTKKVSEFVVAMRKRVSQLKYGNGRVDFGGVKSMPRTPEVYGLLNSALSAGTIGAFCESFLASYGICLHERYGHEYHEYLLEYTARSYEQLEQSLVTAGLKLDGRIMIMGYEGAAFDSYFSNFNDLLGDSLCDETAFKGNSGWSKQPANYFGFLTAFALRDSNTISKNGLFEHIHEDGVELFNKVFELLQRDSFTRLYAFVRAHEESARGAMADGDIVSVLNGFVSFFDFLYEENLTLGDGQSVATQDILFNRKHVQQLTRSSVPTLKFYTGADVTYPILPTEQRNAFATRHAQAFVRKFVHHLTPREGEPTVYVFNSFVDGVGKSTMLGNIKNWIKHGDDMENYEVTDNTSSQLADIFEFCPGVYIADLPAQLSHFTFKPDGYVFVDVASIKGQKEVLKAVLKHFDEHKKELTASYRTRLEDVSRLIAAEGWHVKSLNTPENPYDAFIKNLHLLKLAESNPWIPCEFEGKYYLVDVSNSGEVRTFMSLSEAQSSGLKNVRADQMFFFDGVSMPLEYQVFLNDLTSRCVAQGAKRVVFVDFLSMYMRSSRENIRVNYLMQQMALLFADFNQQDTVYKDLTGNPELLNLLNQKDWFDRVKINLKRESLVRWGLNTLLEEWKAQTLSKISFKESTPRLQQLLAGLAPEFTQALDEAVDTRLTLAAQSLEKSCGMSKEFINIQSISWPHILSFAKTLQKTLVKWLGDRTVRTIWANFGNGDVQDLEQDIVYGQCDRVVRTTDGKALRVRYVIDPSDRNSIIIKPVFRILRTMWYNTLFLLIKSTVTPQGKLRLSDSLPLVPWSVKRGDNGLIYVVQPNCSLYQGELSEGLSAENKFLAGFIDFESAQWTEINKRHFSLDIKEMNTAVQEYAFGSAEYVSPDTPPPQLNKKVTSKVVTEHTQRHGSDVVLPISFAHQNLKAALMSKSLQKEIEQLVKVGDKKRSNQESEQEGDGEKDENELRSLAPDEYQGPELFLGLAAKLEQVMRDPDATLIVRRGNKDDIKTALMLLEQVVIPQYFGVVSWESLATNSRVLDFACSDK